MTWYVNKRPRDRAWMASWNGVGVVIASILGGQDLGAVITLVIVVVGVLWVDRTHKCWFIFLGVGSIATFAAASMLNTNRHARITA